MRVRAAFSHFYAYNRTILIQPVYWISPCCGLGKIKGYLAGSLQLFIWQWAEDLETLIYQFVGGAAAEHTELDSLL